MTQAYYQDTVWADAVHIDKEEAEILREFHFKKLEKLKPKLEKLRDKADGSTKYDEEISKLNNEITYTKMSFDHAIKILRFYSNMDYNSKFLIPNS